MQIGILEPDGFSDVARARLSGLGSVSDYAGADLGRFLADKDALFVRLRHRIGAALLEGAPQLAYLCSPTTGHTHIDLGELTRRGITLISLQGETAFLDGIRATPEHAIGLMLALLRNYRAAFLSESNDHWDRDRCRGEELAGMPVGFIGFGRVGRRVASYLRAFDAVVGCYDPGVSEIPADVRRHASVASLIAASRVVVLAASYEPDAAPIVDADAVSALAGKYFINVARGELVDEVALLAALERKQLAGCAVDVICDETGASKHARWIAATHACNVIVTPHIAGATFTSMRATEEFIADRLIAAVQAHAAAGTMRAS